MAKTHLNIKYFSKLNIIFIVGIVFLVIAVISLRHNYSTMVKLRTAVSVADEKGGDVNKALNNLRSYVYSHMNTNLSTGNASIKPPIQLKYTYERLSASAEQNAKVTNDKVMVDAENVCGAQHPGGGYNPNRVDCVQKYIGVNSVSANPVQDDLYKFDFVSPTWSPDLAGFSLLISIILIGTSILGKVFIKLADKYIQ